MVLGFSQPIRKGWGSLPLRKNYIYKLGISSWARMGWDDGDKKLTSCVMSEGPSRARTLQWMASIYSYLSKRMPEKRSLYNVGYAEGFRCRNGRTLLLSFDWRKDVCHEIKLV